MAEKKITTQLQKALKLDGKKIIPSQGSRKVKIKRLNHVGKRLRRNRFSEQKAKPKGAESRWERDQTEE